MKITLLKISFILPLIFFLNISNAEIVGNATVQNIRISADASVSKANVIVELFGLFPTNPLPTCSGGDDLLLRKDAYFFDEMYSLLLSAKFNELELTVEFSGTAPNACYIDSIQFDTD